MALFKVKRGTFENLSALPFEDGTLYLIKDQHQLYADFFYMENGEQKQANHVLISSTTIAGITGLQNVLNDLNSSLNELELDVENILTNYATKEYVDKKESYVYEQKSASSEWVIQHNLGRYPSVNVIDSANSNVVGEIEYIDINKLKINFIGSFGGTAYLN